MDYINEMNKTVERVVQTVSSREVAEMMEKRHDHLLRDIEKHTAILEKVSEPNFGVADLWILSSYLDAQGKERKEYQVTKKGCEFIAHKTTGEKGDLFTIRYMNKFEEMEQYIKQQVPQLTEEDQAILSIVNSTSKAETALAIKNYKEVVEKPLIETIEKQSDAINELKPHAEYAERVLEDNDGLLNPTQIAKDFGMSGQGLNALLHDLGVQYKQNGQWLLYAKYQGKGYARSVQPDKPYAKSTTKWTQIGKKFIHDILRKNGYKTVLENQQEQQRFDFN